MHYKKNHRHTKQTTSNMIRVRTGDWKMIRVALPTQESNIFSTETETERRATQEKVLKLLREYERQYAQDGYTP